MGIVLYFLLYLVFNVVCDGLVEVRVGVIQEILIVLVIGEIFFNF